MTGPRPTPLRAFVLIGAWMLSDAWGGAPEAAPTPLGGSAGPGEVLPAADRREAARRYLAQGNLTSARVTLLALLRENRNDVEALLALADLQLTLKEAANAQITLKRALGLGAERTRVLLPLARALNDQGRHAEALKEVQPDPGLTPRERADLLAELARARMGTGDREGAQALIDEARRADPDNDAARAAQAVILLRDGKADAAIAALDRPAASGRSASDAWLFRGQLERTRGRAAAAESAMTSAIAADPANWLAFWWRALVRLERGDPNGAGNDLEAARARFPDFTGLRYLDGRLLLARGQPTLALARLADYLRAMPNDPEGHYFAALAALGAMQTGQDDRTGLHLERLAALEPESERLHWLRAKRALALGEPTQAVAELGPLADADRASVASILVLASALREAGDPSGARALIERALKRSPNDQGLLTERAKLQLAASDFAAAAAAARALHRADSGNLDALLVLADASLMAGQLDPALPGELEEAGRRHPLDPRPAMARAGILRAEGRATDACAALAEALGRAPASTPALAAARALDCATLAPDPLRAALSAAQTRGGGNLEGLSELIAGSGSAGIAPLRAALEKDPDDLERRSRLIEALLLDRDRDGARAAVDATPPAQQSEPLYLRAKGIVQMAQGQIEGAVQTFSDLVAEQPGSAEANAMLAQAHLSNRDLSPARDRLASAMGAGADHPLVAAVAASLYQTIPDPVERRELLDDLRAAAPGSALPDQLESIAAIQAQRWGEALPALRRLHQARPADPAIFHRLVEALAQSGDSAGALALLDGWLARNPNDRNALLSMGGIHTAQGRTQDAIAGYRRVLERTPDDAIALNNLAMLLLPTDPKAAVELAERAYRLVPEEPQTGDTLAQALLAAGDRTRALTVSAEAYRAAPGDAGIALTHAQALVANGDLQGARTVLGPLTKQGSPKRQEALAVLKRLEGR